MDPKTEKEAREAWSRVKVIIKGNQLQLEAIIDLLALMDVTSEEGEVIMAFIIGTSLGHRQLPTTNMKIATAIAAGWKFAVEMDEETEQ